MKQKRLLALTLATMLAFSIPVSASATWQQDSSGIWSWTENGERAIGWKTIDGKTYYFDENGNMQTGWIEGLRTFETTVSGMNIWQFADPSGALVSNRWIKTNGKWYYLNEDGYMLSNAITPDGYTVDKTGAWQEEVPVKNLILPADADIEQLGNILYYLEDLLVHYRLFLNQSLESAVLFRDAEINVFNYKAQIEDTAKYIHDVLEKTENIYNYVSDKYGFILLCDDLQICYDRENKILEYINNLKEVKSSDPETVFNATNICNALVLMEDCNFRISINRMIESCTKLSNMVLKKS